MAKMIADWTLVLIIAAVVIVFVALFILWPYVQHLIAGGTIEQTASVTPRYAQ